MLKVKFGDNPLNHCAQEVENDFEIIFWTVNNLVMKTGELVDIYWTTFLDNILLDLKNWVLNPDPSDISTYCNWSRT